MQDLLDLDSVSLHLSPTDRTKLLAVLVCIALFFASLTVVHTLNANSSDIARIKRVFVAEKVCSLSNQGQACRDLFDRLAINLSPNQRYRLACDVLAALETQEAIMMRVAAKCPPPIPSP